MFFHLNPSSGVSIHLQIENQLKNAIAAGALKASDSLPSVRKLALELRINPNTVARAYQNLEGEGLIVTVPGAGTYVAVNVPRLLKSEKLRRLRPYARQIAVEGTQLRLDGDDIMQTVQKELAVLENTDE